MSSGFAPSIIFSCFLQLFNAKTASRAIKVSSFTCFIIFSFWVLINQISATNWYSGQFCEIRAFKYIKKTSLIISPKKQ
ncbi:MAG: DUF5408 family protein [Niabella sp.]|nr:DUF5408 family protein [Niabella sp.]